MSERRAMRPDKAYKAAVVQELTGALATREQREMLLVAIYGETCTKAVAAQIITKSPQTIRTMLADGRLDAACAGTKVDVRSIARYIMSPKEEDFRARNARAGRKWTV